MTSRVLCRLLCVAVSMATLCQGARIRFTSLPLYVASTLSGDTEPFILSCALHNDSGSTVTRVSSIVIRKVEGPIQEDVAKMAYGGQAVAGSWAAGATAYGEIAGKSGYLQAAWSYPSQLQAGGYSCEIVAIQTDGTNIKFKSNLQVINTGPSFNDLNPSRAESKTEINSLKNNFSDQTTSLAESKAKIDSLKNSFSDLTTSLAESKAKIDSLKNSFSDLTAKTSQCQSEISQLKNTIRDLNTNIGRLSTSHSEQGSVVCSHSDNWGEKGVLRENVQEVRFSTPYSKIPLVEISLVRLDVVNDSNTRYRFAIRDLATTGFKIVCATWHYTVIWDMEVRWTSIVG